MRFLASKPWRIFLIAWVLYSVHFSTNVVREHYPAFSLAEHGTFRVDEYQGFHSDIFVHPNGHSVIGNQVFVSALAAIPLLIFDPVLDALEKYSKRKLANDGVHNDEYRTEKPNRVKFFKLVKERGLDLRFGAATLITSAFFMAPLTALCLVLMYRVFTLRGVRPDRATELTFLFGFATPIFFRTSHLNHNMFVMYAMFVSFALLWVRPEMSFPVPLRNRLAAGLFGGMALASDYIGLVILPLLYGYLLISRLPSASIKESFREALAFVIGTIPPILFLLYSQWAMYGNPFLPGQYWMPDQNEYTAVGIRGFAWPTPDLFIKNLFDPGYGIYTWGPILLLGLIPAIWYRNEDLIVPRRERRFIAVSFIALLIFCSANQYARLQWNSGFRYLVPIVPFTFLALADHWVRLPRSVRLPLATLALLHSWVLTVFRELSVQESWQLFLREGIQLPWLRVLRMTSSLTSAWGQGQALSILILGGTFLFIWIIWRYGARFEAQVDLVREDPVVLPTRIPSLFG
jgi:hypothetical protein